MHHLSPLQLTRLHYHPPIPAVLRALPSEQLAQVQIRFGDKVTPEDGAGIVHVHVVPFFFFSGTSGYCLLSNLSVINFSQVMHD